MAGQGGKSLFTGEMNERVLQKWRMIQITAILPLLVCVVCLFYFKGSVLGTIAFFLVLIVGVLLPQIYRDMIQSHLVLKDEIKKIGRPPTT